MLFQDAINNFKHYLTITNKSDETIKSYTADLMSFQIFLENKYNCPLYLKEIQTLDIEDYLYYLKQKKLQAASRSRNLYTLRSFWNYAIKNNICETNITLPIEPIKIQRKERTYLSHEEVNELVNAIDHPLVSLVIQTLYYTGMRISECLNLKINDVDIENHIIHIINGKGGKDRNIPINNHLLPLLKDYVENLRPLVKGDYFFATEKSGKLSPAYINRLLDDACKKLDWQKHVSAHILRHSFASNLIKNGVNLVYVQKLLGHSNLKVTSIYTHANIDDLSQSVNLL